MSENQLTTAPPTLAHYLGASPYGITTPSDAPFGAANPLQPAGTAPAEASSHMAAAAAQPPQVYGTSGMPLLGDEEEEAAQDQRVLETLEGGGDSTLVDEVDTRSIYVGNVDYGATPPELQEHFKNCGAINRITIMVDRFTGHPKGYAYIEFQDESSVARAVTLDQTMFRDRPLKVTPKRKNIPGLGRGGRGGAGPYRGGAMAMMRGGGALRGGGRDRAAMGYFPRYRGRGQRTHFPY